MNPKGKGYGNWAGVSKSPWECRVGMGQGCPRKESGLNMPREEEMGQGSP